MKTQSERSTVTTAVTSLVVPLRPTTRLAKPYHYRRNGIYYLRLRETGSVSQTASVSLKTTDRKAAMDASRRLAETIKAFHLDHPQATWQELRDHLLWVAENLLSAAHDVHSLRDWGDLYPCGSWRRSHGGSHFSLTATFVGLFDAGERRSYSPRSGCYGTRLGHYYV